MYTRASSNFDKRYVANPTNPEAVTILKRMRGSAPPPIVATMRLPLAWVLATLAIIALVSGILTPETWRQIPGINDMYGILAFLALGIGAFGCWGWLERVGFTCSTEPRFYELCRKGAIVEVPFRVYYFLDERLDATNLKDYAASSYQFQPVDFDAIHEIAKADASGAPGTKTWEVAGKELTLLDLTMRRRIDDLLDEIAARIKQSYEDDASERNGLLEGLRKTERLEGE
jgi:hypothetical protein